MSVFLLCQRCTSISYFVEEFAWYIVLYPCPNSSLITASPLYNFHTLSVAECVWMCLSTKNLWSKMNYVSNGASSEILFIFILAFFNLILMHTNMSVLKHCFETFGSTELCFLVKSSSAYNWHIPFKRARKTAFPLSPSVRQKKIMAFYYYYYFVSCHVVSILNLTELDLLWHLETSVCFYQKPVGVTFLTT